MPKVKYHRRSYTVRPNGNLTGAEFVMTGLTLDEGAGYDTGEYDGPRLRELITGHIVSHNLDVPIGAIDLADVRGLFEAWSAAMQEAAVPPTSAAG
jgi:hypothetical protein